MRLEHLGFTDVYDYVPGKSDWTAAALAREGESVGIPNAGDVARRDVPTCDFRDSFGNARKGMEEDGRGFSIAIDGDGVVLGMLYLQDGEDVDDDATTVEQVMHPGPTTIRASEPLEPLLERMKKAGVEAILVTDPEGRLLGLLDRDHATHTLEESRH